MQKTILLFILAIASIARSQDSKNAIHLLDSVYFKHYSYQFNSSKNILEFKSLVNPARTNKIAFFSDSLIKLKQENFQKDLGFGLTSTFVSNQKSEALTLDDNLPFKTRFQTGVEWNLFKNGLFGNKNKSKQLGYIQKVEQETFQTSIPKNSYLESFNLIIASFNWQKNELLNSKLQLNKAFKTITADLYSSHQIKEEEWLKAQQLFEETNSLLLIYTSYNDFTSVKANPQKGIYPIYDINEAELIANFKGVNKDSLLYYFNEINQLSSSWVHKIDLAPFVRYNHYNFNSNQSDRAFFSVGASLSVPLNFDGKRLQKINEVESKLKLENISLQHDFIAEELANNLYEYRYQLYQYSNLYYKRKIVVDAIQVEEDKRRLNYTNYSPLKACNLLDQLYRIDLELLEINQNMYLKILKMYEKNPSIDLSKLLTPVFTTNSQQVVSELGIYIWSKTFQNYSAQQLAELCLKDSFNHVITSLPLDQNQFDHFTHEMKTNHVKIELLIGNNELIHTNNFEEYFQANYNKISVNSIDYIHLDVEPQTFSDWKENRSVYLEKYLKLVENADRFAKSKNLKTAVSIPLSYPEDTIIKIINSCDRVYFMAYENVKIDYLKRKLNPFQLYTDKIVVALRTEDFESKIAMLNFIEHLKKEGYKHFAIHDFTRLQQLNRGESNTKETNK